MFWLGLIGLGLALGGGILSMIGQNAKNQAEQQKAERNRAAYDAQQTAINAQLAQINEQKGQVEQLHGIQEQQLALQGINVAEQGRQAKGSQAASAAVGNVGGASVLRQAEAIQTRLDRAMTGIGLQGRQLDIQLQEQKTSLDVAEAGAQANLVQSQVNEANNDADIQFLQDYGWMSVAAIGLNTAAQAVKIGAGMDWASLDGTPTGSGDSASANTNMANNWVGMGEAYQKSLALENFDYTYPGSSRAVGMYF